MIITIQDITFNTDAIQTITGDCVMDLVYDKPVDIAIVKFGLFNKIVFYGYTVERLRDEINKQIKTTLEQKDVK